MNSQDSLSTLSEAVRRILDGAAGGQDMDAVAGLPVDVLKDVPGAAAALLAIMESASADTLSRRRAVSRLGGLQDQAGLAEAVVSRIEALGPDGLEDVVLRIAGQILGLVGDRAEPQDAELLERMAQGLWRLIDPSVRHDARETALKGFVWLLPALSLESRARHGGPLISELARGNQRNLLSEAVALPGVVSSDESWRVIMPVCHRDEGVFENLVPALVTEPVRARTLFMHWANTRPWVLVPILEEARQLGLQPFLPEDWPVLAENSFAPIRAHVVTCIGASKPQGRRP